MPASPVPRHRRPLVRAVTALFTILAVTTAAGGGRVAAHNTVIFDDAGEAAPSIGIVGDSTLAGVRWWGSFGELRRYNFVLDAESCRRTLEQSCWSREDFRPDTTVESLQRLSGEWGEVLVVMSGYNDSGYLFDDAVDAVVAEARRQEIRRVIWLTLRTVDVSYHDPQQRASADGYREDNRVLYEKAPEHGGYLQIADWASYSSDRADWFSYDGVHLTADGVTGLTSFIADSVDAVLAGADLNPEVPPWATLARGDSGATVAEVQQALLDAGVTAVGIVDGVYGELTADAVAEFQRARGFTVSGTVDAATAIALGIHRRVDGSVGSRPVPPRPDPGSRLPEAPVHAVAAGVAADRGSLALVLGASAIPAVFAALVVLRRRRTPTGYDQRMDHGPPASSDRCDIASVITSLPYDYEQESQLVS